MGYAKQVLKLVAFAAGLAASAAPARCGCTDTADDRCGQKVCVFTPEEATEPKHCWCVECDEVCIPKVRCPWEKGGSKLTCFSWLKGLKKGNQGCGDTCNDTCGSCCDACGCDGAACCCAEPRCGKVKRVRRLKKEKYEVDVCKWKPEIRRLPPCCCGRCGGDAACCDGVSCGD